MKSLRFLYPLVILASTLTSAQTNPVPFINQPLVPNAVAPGGSEFHLTVNGTGFVSGSVVNWNGNALATTFVSSSQLTATVPAWRIAKARTASLTVFNPSPGGGTSNVVFFEVTPALGMALNRSDYGSLAFPWSIVTADFNRDGNLDLAVTNGNNGTVGVFLGNGDGTFQPQVEYSAGAGPQWIAVGDFDGDGKLDLAVTNYSSNVVSVLLGNGDGTFQSPVGYATGGGPFAVAVGDFDGDGKLDLVVTNSSDSTVSVLLGNGDGTFRAHVDYGTGRDPQAVAVGDVNGDGKLDLAVANNSDSTVSLLLGGGDGTFKAHVDYNTAGAPYGVAIADLNGDGELDLAVATFVGNGVSVLLNHGDGTFQPQVTYATGGASISVAVGDVNGDGILDLAVTSAGNNTVSILLGNGDGTFQSNVDYGTATYPISVALGDFNQDGALDFAVATNIGETVSTLLEAGTIAFAPARLNFGVQLVGSRSTAQKVKVTNIGTKNVAISGITVTGTDAGDFGEHNDCPSSLPPKAHCAIRVTFKPTRLGPRIAAVTITDNAGGSPQSVSLRGIGATSGPNATLSTHSLIFATQLIGTTNTAQLVTLNNYGKMTLDITSIVASGDYSENNNCGSSLPPEGGCTISVTFKPTQRGPRTGRVTITDNAPNSPQKVSLTGVGTVVKLDPSSLSFGDVVVGQQSPPQNTTLTNFGKTKLHITSVEITGTDTGDFFVQQNTCPNPGYLGAGKSCTIRVVFKPTQDGFRSADVSVSDDGGGSPQFVSLSGNGLIQNHCSGPCGRGCGRGCGCIFNRCVQADSAILDLFWERQKASELQCAVRPVTRFGCQQ